MDYCTRPHTASESERGEVVSTDTRRRLAEDLHKRPKLIVSLPNSEGSKTHPCMIFYWWFD